MHRLMLWSSRHPVIILLLICIISIAAYFPAKTVRVSTSIDNLMMDGDPDRAYYTQTRDMFGSEAMSIIYVEDPVLFSPEKLSSLQELIFELESVSGIESIESLFSVTDISNENGQLIIQPLIDLVPESSSEATNVLKRVQAHEVINRFLISDSGDTTLIHMKLDLLNGHAEEMRKLSDSIEVAIGKFTGKFHRLEQLGRPYVLAQEAEYIIRDQRTLLPMATGVLVIVLVLMLTSVKGALLPLLTSGVSILWTFAFMGIFQLSLTELSFMVPSLIIVIGSTEDIHLLAEYKSARRKKIARKQAVEQMAIRLAVAVLITALTTISGFASIASSSIPVLREFGMVASFALAANALVTITLIPACLTLLPEIAPKPLLHQHRSKLEHYVLDRLAAARRYPKTCLALICIPCITAGIWGACSVEANNNIIGFFKPDSPIVQRADRMHEKLAGVETFCIRIDGLKPGTFKDPKNLEYAIQLQRHMAEEGWIDRSISLTDYLTHLHQRLDDGSDLLPNTTRGIAEYLLLLHRNEVEPYTTGDFKSLNIIVRHDVRSSRELMPRIEALRQHIEQTCPTHLNAGVTGEMLLVNKAVKAIVRGQLVGLLIIAVFAALLLSCLFKSIRIGCIGLIPNLLPVGIQFGVMALLDIPLNTATSMAAAISIGLAVDDTIHLLMHFYRHNQAQDPQASVDHAVRHLFRPVIATSISLALGFSVMQFSKFTPIGDFGLLAAIVLLTALIVDLLVTPTLLSLKIMHPPRPHKRDNAHKEIT